jgi:hypothetical protein
MPVRQIRKNQKSRKSHSRNPMQKGGDVGRYVLPPAYFGNGTSGYYADGSFALNSCGKQHAVSQGVISANGKWAGPNLYPMMGGACGCSGRRNFKPKTMKGGSSHKKEFKPKTMKGGSCYKKTKSRKSKSRKSQKH